MSYLLFPGRHLLHTVFQTQYLARALNERLDDLDWQDDQRPSFNDPFDQIIFAITSANQANSRYNPIPFHARAIGVDRLARHLNELRAFRYRIIGIPHYRPTDRFAGHILKEIAYQTEGHLLLEPGNCAVVCSTAGVAALFRALGFAILPAEAGRIHQNAGVLRPIDLLGQIVDSGPGWAEQLEISQILAPATRQLWIDFPDVPRRIFRLWRDPLLGETGDLTASRDYASYALRMSNSEIIALKYADIKAAVLPGKVVDEGCGDGALLVPVARDFPDSDLVGLEITGEFIARGQERQRQGEYGGTFIHFHQRSITERIFEDGSIDTTLCNSTLHELWSYGRQAETIHDYLTKKYDQTRPGGRLIIRDVVGPADKYRPIYLWLDDQDGRNEDVFSHPAGAMALEEHLNGLSTAARFKRFAKEFLAEFRSQGKRAAVSRIQYAEETIAGRRFFAVTLKDAAEFLTKKDYTNNWYSELNEEFTFWDFSQWKETLRGTGFAIVENPNEPELGSRVYTNPWIVKNRWLGKVELYCLADGQLQPLDFPPTTMILVARKPDHVQTPV